MRVFPADLRAQASRVPGGVAVARARARNAIRMISGVDPVELGATPREVVWQSGPMTLYRYGDGRGNRAEPILIVMSFVTKPAIFDLRPGMSLVEMLLAKGFDVYLLDWGEAGPVESAYTVSDYTQDFLPEVIGAVRRDAGAKRVSLFGYCLGGTLSLLAVAADPAPPVSGVLLVATPIDFTAMGPISKLVRAGTVPIERLLDENGERPAGGGVPRHQDGQAHRGPHDGPVVVGQPPEPPDAHGPPITHDLGVRPRALPRDGSERVRHRVHGAQRVSRAARSRCAIARSGCPTCGAGSCPCSGPTTLSCRRQRTRCSSTS